MNSTQLSHNLCLGRWRQLVFLLFFSGVVCFGQTNEELFREYQFNFNLPGARANGMGGAFIGVADDATASFTNPAGLAFLNEFAITYEFGDRTLDSREGQIEGAFNSLFLQEEEHLARTAFLSVNFRLKGWYFGVFNYEYLNESQRREFSSRSLSGGVQRAESREIDLNLDGVTSGVGVARRFGKWKAGLTLNHLTLKGDTHYQRNTAIIDIPPTQFFYSSQIQDEDKAWGYSVGLLHETSERISWGAVWRENPKFKLDEEVLETFNQNPLFNETLTVPFVVPDVFGLGARFKMLPQFSVLLDWQKIFYSEVIDDGFLIVESFATEEKENYHIKDIDEFHIGLEWFLAGKRSVWALRTGYYRNPLHAVSYTGDDAAISDRFAGTGLTDEDHFTLGFGWVWRNTIEVDISANLWEVGREYTASFIWRKK